MAFDHHRKEAIREAEEPVSQVLKDRTLLAFLHGALENPESIPRAIFRAQDFATTPETIVISRTQRDVAVSRLAKQATRLEQDLSADLVNQITIAPVEREPKPKLLHLALPRHHIEQLIGRVL